MEDFVSIEAEIERGDMHRTAQSIHPTLSSGQGGRYRLWFSWEVKGVSHRISSANWLEKTKSKNGY
jgi:hypothetical protein